MYSTYMYRIYIIYITNIERTTEINKQTKKKLIKRKYGNIKNTKGKKKKKEIN